jgi:hypothetical protein
VSELSKQRRCDWWWGGLSRIFFFILMLSLFWDIYLPSWDGDVPFCLVWGY